MAMKQHGHGLFVLVMVSLLQAAWMPRAVSAAVQNSGHLRIL